MATVVLVTDDLEMGVLGKFHLERRGHVVQRRVLTPPDYRPDDVDGSDVHCLVLDLSLPPPRCWQVAEVVRSTPGLEAVPLVLSMWTTLDMTRLGRLQPCTWLAKPYGMEALLAAVEKAGSLRS